MKRALMRGRVWRLAAVVAVNLLPRAVPAQGEPTEFREVIVLREIEELSYREISDVVGVPIGTVMSRLARARKRLAAALGVSAQEVG